VNVDLGIWSKLTKIVVGLLLISGLMILALWYLPLIHKNERMRREIIRLDEEIQKQEAAAKQTRDSIEAMRNPKVIERLARQNMGLAKPDETVIVFEPRTTNATVR
jgi:cell division protein FtsB